MKTAKKTLELLSPAGGPEQLKAAVLCGADAVYLGLGNFNARRHASNFKDASLGEVVAYCHLHGVKVYLALNTLLFNREIQDALSEVRLACEAGVDAFIVQDLGLGLLIRQAAPDVPLHASTQMSLHTLDGVNVLRLCGYRRVILAREMTKTEIEKVCHGTDAEIEVFAHGSLCMCLSGQCYMSAVIGGRSGNRGLCAQPCRLPFYEKNSADCGLSLKDLCLIGHLNDIEDIGVDAIKIEGRMKRPEYVAAAVSQYRAALSGGSFDINDLRYVFSRSGFTDGYFADNIGSSMFGVRQKDDVTSASDSLLKKLSLLYEKETGRVGVWGDVSVETEKPVELMLKDGDGNVATVQGDVPSKAVSRGVTCEQVKKSVAKLGGTPYHLVDAEIKVESGLYVSAAQINDLRRRACQILNQLRSAARPAAFHLPEPVNLPSANRDRTPEIWVRLNFPGQLKRQLWQYAEKIILPVKYVAGMDITGLEDKIVAQLPPLLFNEDLLERQLKSCEERGVRYAITGNLGGILPILRHNIKPIGDFGLNATNVYSLLRLKELGICAATLSIELPLADCTAMPPVLPLGIFAFGRLPLMTVRNCPAASAGCRDCRGFRVFRDRKKVAFLVDCGGNKDGGHMCGSQIFNHLPVYLADRLSLCRGLNFITLYFTNESPDETQKVLNEYRFGGRRENITRGLYFRRAE